MGVSWAPAGGPRSLKSQCTLPGLLLGPCSGSLGPSLVLGASCLGRLGALLLGLFWGPLGGFWGRLAWSDLGDPFDRLAWALLRKAKKKERRINMLNIIYL